MPTRVKKTRRVLALRARIVRHQILADMLRRGVPRKKLVMFVTERKYRRVLNALAACVTRELLKSKVSFKLEGINRSTLPNMPNLNQYGNPNNNLNDVL